MTVAGTPTLIPFAPEKVEAFEIGAKNTLMDGTLTLNVAAFLNRYRDLQAQTSIPNPNNPLTGVIALVQNIGRDRAYGVDVEAVIRPSRALTVNLAFNYLNAREIDYAVNVFEFGGNASFCNVNVTPSCVATTGERNTVIVSGADKQMVGQVAAKIRALRPPEPYKGKGIRYTDEFVRRKAGKTAAR